MNDTHSGEPAPTATPPATMPALQARLADLERQLEDQRHSRELGETRLANVLEGTNAASWDWNVVTGETVFNERWAEMVGYTLAELSPVSINTWLALVHPDDLHESSRRLARLFAHEDDFYDFECRMKHRDGHWVWVHDRGKVVEWTPDGAPLRVAGTHTDITRRKHDEQLLRESEERYHAIFEGSLAVKMVVDPTDGTIVQVNSAACEFYGWPREQLQGMNIRQINLLDPVAVGSEMRQAAQGTKNHFFFRHRLASGEVRDVEVYSSPIPLSGRNLLNTIVHDITERRRAERVALEFERQLHQSQKAESLGRMAGAVAHLFNNQLQAVIGNLELAGHGLDPAGGPAARVADALAASHAAARLSGLMLTYLGQAPGHREPVALAEWWRDRESRWRAALPAGATLESEEPAAGLVVTADRQQLGDTLDHLVANAGEALAAGAGAVRVAVYRTSAAEIPLRGRVPFDWVPGEQEYACLEVSDNGCGIPPDDLEKVFDPYFSTKFAGRGMGLPVVLGIVRTHGGGLAVNSEPGRGSTFRVYLPIEG